MKTLEDVAKYLLKKRVSFQYNAEIITVTSSSFDVFKYASYHSETKELVLMDYEYNQFDGKKLK